MLKHAVRDIIRVDLDALRASASLPCIIAIALALSLGLALGQPIWGLVAAFGAMSIGFGAFQTLGGSRDRPLLWATLGMGFSAAVGSLIPHSTPGLVLNALAVGFVYGLLTALGPGVTWITLQCGIAALVATAYPTGLANALGRAFLIVVGGLLQMSIVILFRRFSSWFRPAAAYEDSFSGIKPAVQTLRANLDWSALPFRYALQLGVTLALASICVRALNLPNGYWAPMTALLVLRTDFRETVTRGLARVVGTILGAGLATLLAASLRPGPIALSALVLLFAWLCYSVVTVNYGAFSICITAYIAFLLAFTGLPESAVAYHRVVNTTLGGVLALIAAVPGFITYRKNTYRKTADREPARVTD